MMSRKDYELAANIVRHAPISSEVVTEIMEDAFVTFFQADGNPRFDVVRFRKATPLWMSIIQLLWTIFSVIVILAASLRISWLLDRWNLLAALTLLRNLASQLNGGTPQMKGQTMDVIVSLLVGKSD